MKIQQLFLSVIKVSAVCGVIHDSCMLIVVIQRMEQLLVLMIDCW